MNTALGYAAPLGRLLIGGFFALAGFNKIQGYAGTQGYMEAMGVPAMLLPLVILLELGGGLALIPPASTTRTKVLMASNRSICSPKSNNIFP